MPGGGGAPQGGSGGRLAPDPGLGPAPAAAGGSSSSGGSGGGVAAAARTRSSTHRPVTETVNDTVNQVDETALGGTLGKTGVTGVTEGVVNGAAGPESPVGKVVDETVGAVGGLLGGNR